MDMDCNLPIPVLCGNESAIKLAENPIFHARTKHIEIHYHFVRENVSSEEIDLRKVESAKQVVDILTKLSHNLNLKGFTKSLALLIECLH